MKNMQEEVRAVVLAGGSGTRLWPLSRPQAPKQFLRLLGPRSLLQETIHRLAPIIDASRVVIVSSESTASGEGYLELEPYEKVLEPIARNTGPAIGAAAVRFQVEGIDPVMVVLPSDHLIRDIPAFHAALRVAIDAAADGKLVTFGITPTGPETGFGYIRAESAGQVRKVEAFREKPDRASAEKMLAAGNHFWNSGMFVWRASAILREIRKWQPELAATLGRLETEARTSGFAAAMKKVFAEAPSISIDRGVLEKSDQVLLVEGNFGWSDVGNWDSVYDIAEKDSQGNALQGDAVAIESRGSLVRGESRTVAVVGIQDLCVVETPDAVLVSRRGEGQGVAKVVEALALRGSQRETRSAVARPWGWYTVLEEGTTFKLKRIEVKPGGRLSLQRHKHRSEHWVVVAGEATVTAAGHVSTLLANESTFIPMGTMHRLENRRGEPLHIIEVQVGSYVGEDDIERFDDAYGRGEEKASL